MNHKQLIGLAQALGYGEAITERGLCNGYAHMWAQAVCVGDLAGFNKRMKLLEEYKNDPERLNTDINSIKNKNMGSNHQVLSERERDLLEVPAFFEGVSLYLRPGKFSDVFDRSLEQSDYMDISEYVNSSEMASQGGIKSVVRVIDQYTQSTLTKFLEALANKIHHHPNIAIVFGSGSHAVSARVTGPGTLELIDTNSRVSSVGSDMYYCKGSASRIATALFDSLNPGNDHLPLHCAVLSSANEDLSYVADDGTHKPIRFDDLYGKASIGYIYPSKGNGPTALDLAITRECRVSLPNLLRRIEIVPEDKALSIWGFLTTSTKDDTTQFAETLLKAGLKVNVNNNGKTPLHYACMVGNQWMVEFLLNHGANPNIVDAAGQTPLGIAIKKGKPAMVKALLENGANPNIVDVAGQAPLDIAIKKGKPAITIIQTLLDHGADCNIKAKNGLTPFETALVEKKFSVAEPLLARTRIDENMLRANSPLRKIWNEVPLNLQKAMLIKSLEEYIKTRSNEPEAWFGPSKQSKIDAATALVNKLKEGGSVDLTPHKDVLQKNGRLLDIYRLTEPLIVGVSQEQKQQEKRPEEASSATEPLIVGVSQEQKQQEKRPEEESSATEPLIVEVSQEQKQQEKRPEVESSASKCSRMREEVAELRKEVAEEGMDESAEQNNAPDGLAL